MPQMKKGFRLLFAIVVLCQALPALSAEETLTMAIVPTTAATLHVIAVKMGFLARLGVNVKLITVAAGNLAVTKMLEGEVDLAQATVFPLVTQSFARDDFRILTSIGVSGDDNWIVARSDRGVARVADLRGKKVGVLGGSLPEYVLDLMLLEGGLKRGEVEVRRSDMATALADYTKGELDAILCFGVWTGRAKTVFPGRTAVIANETFVRAATVLAAKTTTLETKREVLLKLLKAYILAEDYVARNPEQARAAVVEWFGLDAAATAEEWKPALYKVRLDQSIIGEMEGIASWQIDGGQAGGKRMPDFLGYFDFRFLEGIDPRRVTVIH